MKTQAHEHTIHHHTYEYSMFGRITRKPSKDPQTDNSPTTGSAGGLVVMSTEPPRKVPNKQPWSANATVTCIVHHDQKGNEMQAPTEHRLPRVPTGCGGMKA